MSLQFKGQTILITGGGSGIGLALAERFAKLDNRVVIAGRSAEKLAAAKQKGFATYAVDMTSADSITKFAKRLLTEQPQLSVVIHNAGVMKNENLLAGASPDIQFETVATNLLGPMRLTDALLPHLTKMKQGLIMTVTSGLAYTPLAMTPTYSATKAAIHSYTQSLRYQLRETNVEVLELVPPYVQTSLMGSRQANDPRAMPLDEFITEVMQILQSSKRGPEILVGRVLPQRTAGDKGREAHEAFFTNFNDQMLAARKEEF